MTPQRLYQTAIAPALSELNTLGIPADPMAARFLLAIALQESGLAHRRQVTAGGDELGPAASFWQFEQGGGCKGVLTHPKASKPMDAICDAYNVLATPAGLWEAMRYHDIVAAAAARLLVYTLPSKLPEDDIAGWGQYLKAWRPGKPHPAEWPKNWALASAVVGLTP
jgi:hypothetical protein